VLRVKTCEENEDKNRGEDDMNRKYRNADEFEREVSERERRKRRRIGKRKGKEGESSYSGIWLK